MYYKWEAGPRGGGGGGGGGGTVCDDPKMGIFKQIQ